MFLKSLMLTSVILLSYQVFFGQSNFPYDYEWNLIDSLLHKKNLPKSALVVVNKVYAAAKKEQSEAQWVRAIIYRIYLNKTEDRDINQVVAEWDQEIAVAPPRVSALLKSVEAEGLFQYIQENLYQFRMRTTIAADTSTDISTWTMNRLNQRIRFLYLSSMENPDLLKKTPVVMYDAVLVKGNVRELRPTLYDLLAWRALDYFRVDAPGLQVVAEDNLMANPNLFSEALYFQHFGFTSRDSASNQLTAISIYQQLLRFHTKDVRLDAWIDADISRIQFVYQYAQMPDKDSLYMNALSRITSQFGTLSISSQAWYLQAFWWATQADRYDPLKDTAHRYDNLKAIALCEQAVKHPDSSEGRWNCEELLRKIHRPSFTLDIESVNLPRQPFRALITYKNINRLYGRIIRTDDATKQLFEEHAYDDKFWSQLRQKSFIKSFLQVIPETADFQEHRVEIKLDALEIGQYALLTSTDPDFANQEDLGLTTFFSSSIAYIKNGLDYFVVDRDTGQPLKEAKLTTFIRKWVSGKYVNAPSRSYQADAKGYMHLLPVQEHASQKLEFRFGNDFLSSSEYISYYRNNEEEGKAKIKLTDYIFTDRSIYRPGQTVYFKGLLISRDPKTKKYLVAGQRKTKMLLKDVNDQMIDSLILQSNEFGAVQGIFHLPVNLLGGEFTIYDETTKDEMAFSVEEYKRPAFYVEFDSVKTTYRLGDSITVAGIARGYAGNIINDAKFSYHVYRETVFPYPWLFRSFPSAEVEVAQGEGFTNVYGKFNIHFPALPDKSVSKSVQPIYHYRVETTITDGNGESRSGSSTVSASYHSFEILSALPDHEPVDRDSLYRVPVTTKNASGFYVKKNLTMMIYALQSPKRLIRSRYWEQPDQFVMNEKEYINLFPNDEYRDESEEKTWDKSSMVYQSTDSSRADGFWPLDKKLVNVLKPGWYEFDFRAADIDGTEIIDKRFIQIRANNEPPGFISYNFVPVDLVVGDPGSVVNFQTGSDAKNLYVIRRKQGLNDSSNKYTYYQLNEQFKRSVIDIHETDRGGISITDVFVINNRWYTSHHVIHVPWTNKELTISYLTWKDKTLPGSPEQWKIKISGAKKDHVAAEILTSMYDASLDQFKTHSWSIPGIYPTYNSGNPWDADDGFGDDHTIIKPPVNNQAREKVTVQYDALINPEYRNRVMIRHLKFGAAPGAPEKISIVKDDGVMDSTPPKLEMAKFTPPKMVKDGEANDQEPITDYQNPPADYVQIRKNFNETAFFQPDLKTDAQGNVEIIFTMPDALTRWKWMILAHTKELAFGYSEKEIITQKEMMIQTNMPRFFREGDSMLLPIKIVNLSAQNMNGTVQLEWMDAETNQPVDQIVGNTKGNQPFTVNASQSMVVFFPAIIPAHFTKPISYRVVAKAEMTGTGYSDGEEAAVPVLSNRMLVTESLPINMTGKTEQGYVFEKLLNSGSSNTLQNQGLTVEYTTNPAWYAVQSLPYLMEFPYECAEQTFNRFYANALAAHIVKVAPLMQSIFEKWKNTDTATLLSNLQKNEELKSALLRETPWVLEAQSETQQKKNLALLFDLLKMRSALKGALDKLQLMQSEAGGFPWFKGGRDDRYITQYIISGIGRLKKLNALPADLQVVINKMVNSGLGYLDREINRDYSKRDKWPAAQNLGSLQIQYLYVRSLFPDINIPPNETAAINYYRKQSIDNWSRQSVYMQAMIALYLHRTGEGKTASDILASLKENATTSEETGMYWKSVRGGFNWQDAPIETQSILVETFQELNEDQRNINQMKYWLLQQKRTSHWPSTKATADACYALLLSGSDWLSSNQMVNIKLGSYEISSSAEKTDAGTGYLKKQIPGDQVKPEMGNINVSIVKDIESINGQPRITRGRPSTVNDNPPTVNTRPSTASPSWGAIYWQYFENLDKITAAQTHLSITKNLFIEKNSGKGSALEAVTEQNILKPGNKLVMRIILRTDRDLEYVHLKDMRAACLEPVNVLSGYQWQDGLGYYETTRDASTSFFFDRLPTGVYVFEYPVFVTTAGMYGNGISSLECMYAPEFAAHSEGIRIHVESK